MLPTILIGAAVAGLMALAIRHMIRQRKAGGCAGCPSAKGCPNCTHHN